MGRGLVSDVDDFEDWKYDLYAESDEPYCWGCWNSESGSCWSCALPPLRIRRRAARRERQRIRQWRKHHRHANDRFWQTRNRPLFDNEAPF